MASKISCLSLLMLMLLCECLCAPIKLQGGFKVGGTSNLGLQTGVDFNVTRDGILFNGNGEGVLGADWKGGAYGGAYAGINDKIIAGEATGEGQLGLALKPGLQTAIGYDRKNGRIPFKFLPSLSIPVSSGFGGNFMGGTGEDARDIAQRLGAVLSKPTSNSGGIF